MVVSDLILFEQSFAAICVGSPARTLGSLELFVFCKLIKTQLKLGDVSRAKQLCAFCRRWGSHLDYPRQAGRCISTR